MKKTSKELNFKAQKLGCFSNQIGRVTLKKENNLYYVELYLRGMGGLRIEKRLSYLGNAKEIFTETAEKLMLEDTKMDLQPYYLKLVHDFSFTREFALQEEGYDETESYWLITPDIMDNFKRLNDDCGKLEIVEEMEIEEEPLF